eukprot:scaffold300_cov258-Pinguiococcus_pyrenoidosus.AAC.23
MRDEMRASEDEDEKWEPLRLCTGNKRDRSRGQKKHRRTGPQGSAWMVGLCGSADLASFLLAREFSPPFPAFPMPFALLLVFPRDTLWRCSGWITDSSSLALAKDDALPPKHGRSRMTNISVYFRSPFHLISSNGGRILTDPLHGGQQRRALIGSRAQHKTWRQEFPAKGSIPAPRRRI